MYLFFYYEYWRFRIFSEFYYPDLIVTENEGNLNVFLSATSAEAAENTGENQEAI